MSRLSRIASVGDYPSDVDQATRKTGQEVMDQLSAYHARLRAASKQGGQDKWDFGPWGFVLHDPELCKRLNALSLYIMDEMPWQKNHLELSALVILYISKKQSSVYLFRAHYERAVRLGVAPNKLAALDFYSSSTLFSLEERIVLDFVDAAIGGKVSNEEFDAAQRQFTECDFVGLIVSIGYWTLWNSLLNVTQFTTPGS